MKKFIALAVALVSFGAFAADNKHMVDFDGQSLAGSLNWTTTKVSGSSASRDKAFSFNGRYAYSLTDHVQVGGQLNYNAGRNSQASKGKTEGYTALVGAYWNFDTDFRKSWYVSGHIGWAWDNTFASTASNSRTESWMSRWAVGKRMPLFSENFTYSPEIVYTTTTPTKSGSTQYANDLAIKYLNFSYFF